MEKSLKEKYISDNKKTSINEIYLKTQYFLDLCIVTSSFYEVLLTELKKINQSNIKLKNI